MIKVKTLTGKEIEIDIEPTDKVSKDRRMTMIIHINYVAEERLSSGTILARLRSKELRSGLKRRKGSHHLNSG